jgi:hypothetical protein
MHETNDIVSRLLSSEVTTSHGDWLSDGCCSWVKDSTGELHPTSDSSKSMAKIAAIITATPPHPSIHNHRKRKMHVHIGGPRSGLSEITVVEITPHGVVRNRFYKVKCEDNKVYKRLSSLAKIKSWGNLFKMVTALRNLV